MESFEHNTGGTPWNRMLEWGKWKYSNGKGYIYKFKGEQPLTITTGITAKKVSSLGK